MTIDPTTLAAALRDATVEQLKEDAALYLSVMKDTPEAARPRTMRLAALALAVARMQELSDGTGLSAGNPVNKWWMIDRSGGGADWGWDDDARTLPAALAAFLEAE